MTDETPKLRRLRVYALLTEEYCRRAWQWTARRLIEGGVDAIQLREKEMPDGRLLERARRLRELTRDGGVLLIVNDRPDVALLCGADGVHLGQDDLPTEDVRELAGPDLVIGLSTHDPDQAAGAAGRGADYAAVGPVFATPTRGYRLGGGPDFVRRMCAATDLPTVAIGGITPDSAAAVIEAGATGVAACRALCAAEDPAAAVRRFRELFDEGQT